MIETKIYIGLNDATTKQQMHSTETYADIMKYVCNSYHVPFALFYLKKIKESGHHKHLTDTVAYVSNNHLAAFGC